MMKNTNRNVQEFLENESFVKWVVAPDDSLNQKWESWMNDNQDKRQDAIDAKELILSMSFNKESKELADNELWKRIENTIVSNDDQSTANNSRFINFRYFLRIAAVLVLVAFITVFYYENTKTIPANQIVQREIITKENPNGIKTQIRLPDGTKVWLNSGSKLTYPSFFFDDSRNVELTGEAFFDVVKNKSKPFIIQTPYFTTTVLGTSFSVKAYKENVPKVSLIEGKVKVSKLGSDKIIEPGQQVILVNGKLVSQTFDFDEEIGWKDGTLVFKEAKPESIFQKIERWYGVTVEYDVDSFPDSKYSGHHKDQSLETVMKGISYSLNFNYQIEDKNVKILFN